MPSEKATQKWLKQMKEREEKNPVFGRMHYVGWYMPQNPRPGWALAHNSVAHNTKTGPGVNGFRAWWFSPPSLHRNFILCPCGWAPGAGKHYAMKDHARWWKEKAARKAKR